MTPSLEPALQKELFNYFARFDAPRELGQCVVGTGEFKIDLSPAVICVPTQRAQQDKDALAFLTQAFAEYRQIADPHIQSVLALPEDTLSGTTAKNVPVLAMVECAVARLDDTVDALEFDDRLTIFGTLLQALAHLHAAGLVHGNLHPGVIRSETPEGRLKLCDIVFAHPDAARVIDQPLAYQSGTLVQSGAPNVHSDLYAIGMIGYRLFLGPGGAERVIGVASGSLGNDALRQRILDGQVDVVTKDALCPDDPEAARYLAPVLRRLIGNADLPFANAADARQALTQSKPLDPINSPVGASPVAPYPPKQLQKSNGLMITALGVAIAAVLGFAGYNFHVNDKLQEARDDFIAKCRDVGDPPAVFQGAVAEYQSALDTAIASGNADQLSQACADISLLADLRPVVSDATDLLDRYGAYSPLQSLESLALPQSDYEIFTDAREAVQSALDALGLKNRAVLTTQITEGQDTLDAHHARVQESFDDTRDAHLDGMQQLGARLESLTAMADLIGQTAQDPTALAALDEALGRELSAAQLVRRTAMAQTLAQRIATHQERLSQIKAPETVRSAATGVFADAEDKLIAALTPFPENVETASSALEEALSAVDDAMINAASQTLAKRIDAFDAPLAKLQAAALPESATAAGLAERLATLRAGSAPFDTAEAELDALAADIASAQAEIETLLSKGLAAFETAQAAAQTAEGPAAKALAAFALQITRASTSVDAGALRRAALAYDEMTRALETEVTAMRTVFDDQRSAALALIEQSADKTAAAAKAARAQVQEAAAKADAGQLQNATDQISDAVETLKTALTAYRTDPRPFAIGMSAQDIARLQDLCAVSRVRSNCSTKDLKPSTATDVTLSPFALDKTEASAGEFEEFIAKTNHPTSAKAGSSVAVIYSTGTDSFPGATWSAPNGTGTTVFREDPVTVLSGNDAAAFCAAQGKRLPTWAEWQATARSAQNGLFPFGEWRRDAAIWQGNGAARQPVASGRAPNDTGHLHMAGNAREWVTDDTGAPIGLAGGSWLSVHPYDLSSVVLLSMPAARPGLDFGVRCAKDLKTWPEN